MSKRKNLDEEWQLAEMHAQDRKTLVAEALEQVARRWSREFTVDIRRGAYNVAVTVDGNLRLAVVVESEPIHPDLLTRLETAHPVYVNDKSKTVSAAVEALEETLLALQHKL